MKQLFKLIAGAFLVSGLLSGCASPDPAPTQLPEVKAAAAAPTPAPDKAPAAPKGAELKSERAERTPAEVGQLILVWVAGYCEGWSKATGENFEQCFDTTVEDTMQQYKANTGVDVSLKAGK